MTDRINNGFHENSDQDGMTNEKWQAIIHNDASYNEKFFYAVKTTKIFCKPSCKSRVPNQVNVRIFQTAEQALQAHFRPCKRCKPTNEKLPDDEWISLIREYIDQNFTEKVSLEVIADMAHGSPYHLHRTFKRICGITPLEYLQEVRINAAKRSLLETNNSVAEIAQSVGIPNSSYFITLFKKKLGLTPAKFRQLNQTE